MNVNKPLENPSSGVGNANNVPEAKRGYSSWWYWRRSGDKHSKNPSIIAKNIHESDNVINAEQTDVLDLSNQSRKSVAIDVNQQQQHKQELSKNLDIKHSSSEHLEYNRSVSISDDMKTNELYRKSLRLTTEQIVSDTFLS